MCNRRMDILLHAYKTVPVYRRFLKENNLELNDICKIEDWYKVPLITKGDLAFAGSNAISEEYLGDFAMGRTLKNHTSGSQGVILDIYWNLPDYQKSLFPLWLERWKSARIHPRDKVCFFNTVLENDKLYLFSKNAMYISKSNLNKSRMKDIYDNMIEFAPKWLLLHPSLALLICDFIETEKLPPVNSVRYIELTGETILDSAYERICRVFMCVVKCHYGTMEVNAIGYEHQRGVYRLFETSTYVEILDDKGALTTDGKIGNIYITSLHNHVMPIVRYAIGDCGRILKKSQDDNRRYLELTRTRKNSHILLPNGTLILPDILLRPVDILNEAYGVMVYQFQAIQKERRVIELKIVLEQGFSEQEFMQMYMNLLQEEWANEFVFEFLFKNSLYPTTSGKLQWFENAIISS